MDNRSSSRPTIVQACLDVQSVDEALDVAQMAVRAGVDWLEVGTPLILFAGIEAVRSIAAAFPDRRIMADMKLMDGAYKYVVGAAQRGASMVSVCGAASDATIRAGVLGARATGARLVVDLYACPDPVGRANEVAALGAEIVYLHYGADQLTEDPDGDETMSKLQQLRSAGFELPVGVVAFSTEGACQASTRGADIILVGHPYLTAPGSEAMLKHLVSVVRQATSLDGTAGPAIGDRA
jgi:3-keto-L-gulonate-6-phosphate decarboxylase